jgi:hypothetical protein
MFSTLLNININALLDLEILRRGLMKKRIASEVMKTFAENVQLFIIKL